MFSFLNPKSAIQNPKSCLNWVFVQALATLGPKHLSTGCPYSQLLPDSLDKSPTANCNNLGPHARPEKLTDTQNIFYPSSLCGNQLVAVEDPNKTYQPSTINDRIPLGLNL